MAIERKTLRSQVRDELLARMRSGEAQPGEGINEVQLASELGVSRTPLREALIGLESEGQITSENGKGFRFVKLSATEFEELGPVIATLEGLAIELTPLVDLQTIGRQLVRMSAEFHEDIAAHSEVAHRDDEWHELMLSACPNARLLELIGGVRGLFHRYESLLVSNEAMIGRVAAEHATIAHCLAEGDVAGAQTALKSNWLNGVQRILANAELTATLV
ncbi:GntR family transcriptional regulator [Glaciibacter psychrotolerans]|uniref:DNA-binding GntR family transcriptional regulator n=1 Tax=Glaciibacter psychrotolerans TaxID=670054 RepID=A0A7Z0EF85_9MICO|nr:GntR family transcriptional regulator [Leifsonia psychrotolerans]NYJ20428.1 DNA-binding GntR family transcriptional regulator [Leifsonia psychrotolerans]